MPKAPNQRIPTAHTQFSDDELPGATNLPDDEYESLYGKDNDAKIKEPAGEQEDPPADPPADDELPEEFKGKSAAELARMYKEAQSLIGRQGRELGEVRKLADRLVQSDMERRAAEKAAAADAKNKGTVETDPTEFFTDPDAAVRKAIESHPMLKKLDEAAKEQAAREIIRTRNDAKAAFDQLHPDAQEILGTAEFRQWVEASPFRKKMLLRAHRAYDLEAGHELFATYKELRGKKAQGSDVAADAAARDAAKAAARVPGGGTRRVAKSGDKPKFRRADLMRMRLEEPERYEGMIDEITLAYAEGRVK